VRVRVNGTWQELVTPTSVAAVVTSLTPMVAGIAVAVNEMVVPRGAWETTRLDDGDRVEILTAVQGG
jgi:sulfur carrier protein